MKATRKSFEKFVSKADGNADVTDLFWDWVVRFSLNGESERELYESFFSAETSEDSLPF